MISGAAGQKHNCAGYILGVTQSAIGQVASQFGLAAGSRDDAGAYFGWEILRRNAVAENVSRAEGEDKGVR